MAYWREGPIAPSVPLMKSTMPVAPPDLPTTADFPAVPASRRRALRRWKERCLLSVIQPLRRFPPRHQQAIGIITYHQVSAAARHDRDMLNVTPARFQQQMEGLLQLGYEPWSLRRVLAYEQAGEPIPREVFVVVFDDGFENNYLNAWPVLRRLNIPATIFLATGYLGQDRPFPFDTRTETRPQTTAAEAWRPLTLRQCHEMLESSLVDLGTHTHTHQDFRRRPGDFALDLERSLELLEREFGVIEPTFSFPYGFVKPRLVSTAKRLGVRCGLTADCRLVLPQSDPFAWGRFGASEFDNAHSLAAKLDGWYCRVREIWRAWRRQGRAFLQVRSCSRTR